MRYSSLFEPIQVGPLTIPNRIVRSAHGTLLTGDALIAYHEARAIGGVGMSTLEATSVHDSAPSLLPLYSDDVIPFYEQISARMRPHGMKLLQQIYHPGAATKPKKAPLTWSASAIPSPNIGNVPMPMSKGMIADLVESFALAARRVRQGGLDGVDVHASSGYLIEQFMSPATNLRDDEYGGSFENRTRLTLDVLRAIRAEVGEAMPIFVRLSCTDYIEGGWTIDDTVKLAALLKDAGCDLIDCSSGGVAPVKFTEMDIGPGYQVQFAEAVRHGAAIASGAVGLITDAEQAEQLRPLVPARSGDLFAQQFVTVTKSAADQ